MGGVNQPCPEATVAPVIILFRREQRAPDVCVYADSNRRTKVGATWHITLLPLRTRRAINTTA